VHCANVRSGRENDPLLRRPRDPDDHLWRRRIAWVHPIRSMGASFMALFVCLLVGVRIFGWIVTPPNTSIVKFCVRLCCNRRILLKLVRRLGGNQRFTLCAASRCPDIWRTTGNQPLSDDEKIPSTNTTEQHRPD